MNVRLSPEASSIIAAGEQELEDRSRYGGRRLAAQGLTFGFGDELEAMYRSSQSGRSYQEELADIRGSMEAYRERNPMTAIGLEALGSLPLAFVPGAGLVGAGRGLARAALSGAAGGALYGVGTGEGSVEDRLSRAPGGAAAGAAGGVVGQVAGTALGSLATRAIDTARRTLGRRGSRAVEAEIQRLVELTGKTPDQIISDIQSGRLLAENRTLRDTVRSMARSSQPSGTVLREALEARPAETAAAAQEALEVGLTGQTGRARTRQMEDYASQRAARSTSYGPFDNTVAPPQLIDAFKIAVRAEPELVGQMNSAFRRQAVLAGQEEIGNLIDVADGVVTINGDLTVGQIEMARSILAEAAQGALRSGERRTTGRGMQRTQEMLRDAIDTLAPEIDGVRIGQIRANVATEEAANQAFALGERSFTMNLDDAMAQIRQIRNRIASNDPNVSARGQAELQAFRDGFLATFQQRMGTPSRASVIRGLGDESGMPSNSRQIMEEIFPDEASLNNALNRLQVAQEAAATSGEVLRGSGTAPQEAARVARIGNTAVQATRAALGDTDAALSVINGIFRNMADNPLSEAESMRVAQILIERNPDVVMNALRDPSGLRRLQDLIEQSIAPLRGAGGIAGAQQAGEFGAGLLDMTPGTNTGPISGTGALPRIIIRPE